MSNFNNWFNTFIDEKDVPYSIWEIEATDDTIHVIDSDAVIEAIKGAPAHEQNGIKAIIVKIDFMNGNVNDYFRHLAQALVNNY